MAPTKFRDLPLDKVEVAEDQVRKRGADKNLEELQASIAAMGLLEPIIVSPQGKSFEVIAGQRRFLACQALGWTTIPAVVLPGKTTEEERVAIGITENLVREPLSERDLIDACTTLYRKYGSVRNVAEETGLPIGRVQEYVRYDRLSPNLKEAVDEGVVDLRTALVAEDFPDRGDAIHVAQVLDPLTQGQRNAVVKKVSEAIQQGEQPDIEDIVQEVASGPSRLIQLQIALPKKVNDWLKKEARKNDMPREQFAAELIAEAMQLRIQESQFAHAV